MTFKFLRSFSWLRNNNVTRERVRVEEVNLIGELILIDVVELWELIL